MKKLILSLALALVSSGLFAQQVIEKSGMRILSLKRNTSNGNANNFEFKISSNINGTDPIAQSSLSILATQKAADIALLADPGRTNPQFLLKANGRVGINTTSPDAYLTVAGDVTFGKNFNNRWVFHTPDDSRKTMYLAPANGNSAYDWDKATEFRSDGEVRFNKRPRIKGSDAGLWIEAGTNDWFVGRNGSNFRIYNGSDRLTVTSSGNVGIGTTNPRAKLAVNGTIRAEKVRVMTNIDLADYVFAPDYALRPLAEVEQYVEKHQHLPGVPSAQEVKEEGLEVAEFQNKLLEKVEELTLYTIDQEKRILAQEQRLQALEKENAYLKTLVADEDR